MFMIRPDSGRMNGTLFDIHRRFMKSLSKRGVSMAGADNIFAAGPEFHGRRLS